jgi:hypothetical protein
MRRASRSSVPTVRGALAVKKREMAVSRTVPNALLVL